MRFLEGKVEEGPSSRARSIIAIGSLVAAVAVLSYGMVASCSPAEDSDVRASIAETTEAHASGQYAKMYYGTANWPFMTDETLTRFEDSFYEWLLDGGLSEGSYVYLHSEEVQCEDGVWSAYARTPVDDAYYKIRFDAQTKETSYEAVLAPEFASQSAAAREEASAASEQQEQSEDASSDRRDASRNIAVDDTASLRALMPERAAETLPTIIREYAASKGLSTSPALCSVYPSSATTEGAVTRFQVLMYDDAKRGYLIDADYDAGSDRFGLSLQSL